MLEKFRNRGKNLWVFLFMTLWFYFPSVDCWWISLNASKILNFISSMKEKSGHFVLLLLFFRMQQILTQLKWLAFCRRTLCETFSQWTNFKHEKKKSLKIIWNEQTTKLIVNGQNTSKYWNGLLLWHTKMPTNPLKLYWKLQNGQWNKFQN